ILDELADVAVDDDGLVGVAEQVEAEETRGRVEVRLQDGPADEVIADEADVADVDFGALGDAEDDPAIALVGALEEGAAGERAAFFAVAVDNSLAGELIVERVHRGALLDERHALQIAGLE